MAETALDIAHAAMETGAEADRLRFYDRLADAELFVLLTAEPKGEHIAPRRLMWTTAALFWPLIVRNA